MNTQRKCLACEAISNYVKGYARGVKPLELNLGPFAEFEARTECEPCQTICQLFRASYSSSPKPSCYLRIKKAFHDERFWITTVGNL
jgi:hypothetical protein